MVVEHKGLSDESLFFASHQRASVSSAGGQITRHVGRMSDDEIGAKNIVQEGRSEPLYVGVLRRLEKVKGKLRMHRV